LAVGGLQGGEGGVDDGAVLRLQAQVVALQCLVLIKADRTCSFSAGAGIISGISK